MNKMEYNCPEILKLDMELEGLLCESGEVVRDNAGMLDDNDWGAF